MTRNANYNLEKSKQYLVSLPSLNRKLARPHSLPGRTPRWPPGVTTFVWLYLSGRKPSILEDGLWEGGWWEAEGRRQKAIRFKLQKRFAKRPVGYFCFYVFLVIKANSHCWKSRKYRKFIEKKKPSHDSVTLTQSVLKSLFMHIPPGLCS